MKKNNQSANIVRIIIALVLGYLGYDQYLLSQKIENENAATLAKPRKRKILPVVKVAEENKAIVNETSEINPIKKVVNPPIAVVPPIENINIATKEPIEAIAPVVDKAVEEVPVIEVKPVEETVPKMGEVKAPKQLDKGLDNLVDSLGSKEKAVVENTVIKETKLEDKIVADDVYITPPAYDQLGRGLVYNCKEKHWACIDKLSYVSCNKNMKWNQSHKKPAECEVVNVYNSEDDCSVMQKYNVSVSLPTTFCQK